MLNKYFIIKYNDDMICEKCSKNLPEKDFMLSKCMCYKCSFKEKNKIVDVSNKHRECLICGNTLIKSKWKYCSEECSLIGRPKNRWYQKIKVENAEFNIRLNRR